MYRPIAFAAALVAAGTAFGGSGALAEPASALTRQRISSAEQVYAAGNLDEAARLLEAARRDVARDAALSVDSLTLISREAAGFGLYNPRGSDRFSQGEPIRLYFEPKNLTIVQDGDFFRAGFVADVRILNISGGVEFQQLDYLSMHYNSRSYMNDIFVNLTLSLQNMLPGRYTIEIRLRDSNSRKAAEIRQMVVLL